MQCPNCSTTIAIAKSLRPSASDSEDSISVDKSESSECPECGEVIDRSRPSRLLK